MSCQSQSLMSLGLLGLILLMIFFHMSNAFPLDPAKKPPTLKLNVKSGSHFRSSTYARDCSISSNVGGKRVKSLSPKSVFDFGSPSTSPERKYEEKGVQLGSGIRDQFAEADFSPQTRVPNRASEGRGNLKELHSEKGESRTVISADEGLRPMGWKLVREPIKISDGTEPRTVYRLAPYQGLHKAPEKPPRPLRMYGPADNSKISDMEAVTFKKLSDSLLRLQPTVRNKVPWQPEVSFRQLDQELVEIRQFLIFMVEHTLDKENLTTFKRIKEKFFKHYKSQVNALDILREVMALCTGFQDVLRRSITDSTDLLNFSETFEVLRSVRDEAVIPVSRRINSSMGDIITNVGHFIGLDRNALPSTGGGIKSDENPVLAPQWVLNSIREALSLTQKSDVRRSIEQIPDSTEGLLKILQNLRNLADQILLRSSKQPAQAMNEELGSYLNALTEYFSRTNSAPNWLAESLQDRVSQKKSSIKVDCFFQDMLVQNMMIRALDKILTESKKTMGISAIKSHKTAPDYEDLASLIIEKLEDVREKAQKRQLASLSWFLDTAEESTSSQRDKVQLRHLFKKSILHRFLRHANRDDGSIRELEKILHEILSFNRIELTHEEALEKVDAELQNIQKFIREEQALGDDLTKGIIEHQIKKWLEQIAMIKLFQENISAKFPNKLANPTEHAAVNGKPRRGLRIEFDYEVENLVNEISVVHQDLEKLISAPSKPFLFNRPGSLFIDQLEHPPKGHDTTQGIVP